MLSERAQRVKVAHLGNKDTGGGKPKEKKMGVKSRVGFLEDSGGARRRGEKSPSKTGGS